VIGLFRMAREQSCGSGPATASSDQVNAETARDMRVQRTRSSPSVRGTGSDDMQTIGDSVSAAPAVGTLPE